MKNSRIRIILALIVLIILSSAKTLPAGDYCDVTILPEDIKVTNLFPYYLGSGDTDRCKIEVRITNLGNDACSSGGVVQVLSKRVDRSPGYGGHYFPLPFDKDVFNSSFSAIAASGESGDVSSTITLYWTLPSDFRDEVALDKNAGVWRLALRVIPTNTDANYLNNNIPLNYDVQPYVNQSGASLPKLVLEQPRSNHTHGFYNLYFPDDGDSELNINIRLFNDSEQEITLEDSDWADARLIVNIYDGVYDSENDPIWRFRDDHENIVYAPEMSFMGYASSGANYSNQAIAPYYANSSPDYSEKDHFVWDFKKFGTLTQDSWTNQDSPLVAAGGTTMEDAPSGLYTIRAYLIYKDDQGTTFTTDTKEIQCRLSRENFMEYQNHFFPAKPMSPSNKWNSLSSGNPKSSFIIYLNKPAGRWITDDLRNIEGIRVMKVYRPHVLYFQCIIDLIDVNDPLPDLKAIIDEETVISWDYLPNNLMLSNRLLTGGPIQMYSIEEDYYIVKTFPEGNQINRLKVFLDQNNISFEDYDSYTVKVHCGIEEIMNIISYGDYYSIESYIPLTEVSNEVSLNGSSNIENLHPAYYEAVLAGLGVLKAHEMGQKGNGSNIAFFEITQFGVSMPDKQFLDANDIADLELYTIMPNNDSYDFMLGNHGHQTKFITGALSSPLGMAPEAKGIWCGLSNIAYDADGSGGNDPCTFSLEHSDTISQGLSYCKSVQAILFDKMTYNFIDDSFNVMAVSLTTDRVEENNYSAMWDCMARDHRYDHHPVLVISDEHNPYNSIIGSFSKNSIVITNGGDFLMGKVASQFPPLMGFYQIGPPFDIKGRRDASTTDGRINPTFILRRGFLSPRSDSGSVCYEWDEGTLTSGGGMVGLVSLVENEWKEKNSSDYILPSTIKSLMVHHSRDVILTRPNSNPVNKVCWNFLKSNILKKIGNAGNASWNNDDEHQNSVLLGYSYNEGPTYANGFGVPMVNRSIDLIRRDHNLRNSDIYPGRKVIEGIFLEEGQKVSIPLKVGNPIIPAEDLLQNEPMDIIVRVTLVWDDYTAYLTNNDQMGGINNDLDVIVTRELANNDRKCYLPYTQKLNPSHQTWDCTHHPENKVIYKTSEQFEEFWEKVLADTSINYDPEYRDNKNYCDNIEIIPLKLFESEGDWTQDDFEVTVICREIISSWQTFSIVVDYFENPVYPPEDPYDCVTSKSGYQCEIPDNGYWESRDYLPTPIPTPTAIPTPHPDSINLWEYPAPKGDFDESDRSQYPIGVGRIFRTGKQIQLSDEVYFSIIPIINSPGIEHAVIFKNELDERVAVISNDGSLFLKGHLITNKPILQNNPEELPPGINQGLKSVYKFWNSEIRDYSYVNGPNDWILEPLPTPTPTPTSTPTGINQDPQKREWIIKNADGDIIALLDLSSGDLTIKGEYKPWSESDSITGSKFIVRTSSNPDSKVFIIDQNGNLFLRGALCNNSL